MDPVRFTNRLHSNNFWEFLNIALCIFLSFALYIKYEFDIILINALIVYLILNAIFKICRMIYYRRFGCSNSGNTA